MLSSRTQNKIYRCYCCTDSKKTNQKLQKRRSVEVRKASGPVLLDQLVSRLDVLSLLSCDINHFLRQTLRNQFVWMMLIHKATIRFLQLLISDRFRHPQQIISCIQLFGLCLDIAELRLT